MELRKEPLKQWETIIGERLFLPRIVLQRIDTHNQPVDYDLEDEVDLSSSSDDSAEAEENSEQPSVLSDRVPLTTEPHEAADGDNNSRSSDDFTDEEWNNRPLVKKPQVARTYGNLWKFRGTRVERLSQAPLYRQVGSWSKFVGQSLELSRNWSAPRSMYGRKATTLVNEKKLFNTDNEAMGIATYTFPADVISEGDYLLPEDPPGNSVEPTIVESYSLTTTDSCLGFEDNQDKVPSALENDCEVSSPISETNLMEDMALLPSVNVKVEVDPELPEVDDCIEIDDVLQPEHYLLPEEVKEYTNVEKVEDYDDTDLENVEKYTNLQKVKEYINLEPCESSSLLPFSTCSGNEDGGYHCLVPKTEGCGVPSLQHSDPCFDNDAELVNSLAVLDPHSTKQRNFFGPCLEPTRNWTAPHQSYGKGKAAPKKGKNSTKNRERNTSYAKAISRNKPVHSCDGYRLKSDEVAKRERPPRRLKKSKEDDVYQLQSVQKEHVNLEGTYMFDLEKFDFGSMKDFKT